MKLFFSGNIPALPSGLSVAVYEHDGSDTPATLATITDRAGSPISQPGFVTDAAGRFEFSGDDGLYDVKLGGGAGAPDTSWNGGAALWIRGQSLSDPGVAAGKNKLINSCFRVNQRAVAGTVVLAAGDYGHDRWKAGSGGCTYTFATVANVTTITISAGTLVQVVEGLNLRSGMHVLSWGGTAQGQVDTGGYGASGVTATLTGGTNAEVEFGTGTLFDVQLEEGSASTVFEQHSVELVLALCRRYYEVGKHITFAPGATSAAGHVLFYTEKRAVPTVIRTAQYFTANETGTTITGTDSQGFSFYNSSNSAAGGKWSADAEL